MRKRNARCCFGGGVTGLLWLAGGISVECRHMAKLTFLGAAGCVTGSKYLVEAAGKKLLVDCGLFQGTDNLKERNWNRLPVDPKTIDYLVLTHAHLDHTGWLPVLVRDGYNKTIYANPATIELTEILLRDSGHLQEEETQDAQKHKWSKHPQPRALYTSDDVEPVLRLLRPMPRNGGFDISPEFHIESYDAGHILGSSSLELTIHENGKKTVTVFSGDIGRSPANPERSSAAGDEADQRAAMRIDVWRPGARGWRSAAGVGRYREPGGEARRCDRDPGVCDRADQTFMYYLRQLENLQRVPKVPVYVDSPMALSATELYLKHNEDYDLESDGRAERR